MSDFNLAIPIVLQHEGIYSDDPKDPGGPTRYGISLRWLKHLGDANGDDRPDGDLDHDGDVDGIDIRSLSKAQAMELYRVHWWNKYRYEHIASQVIATKTLDLAVNMGSQAAHRCLQRAIRAASGLVLTEDGVLGPLTFQAIDRSDPLMLLAAFRSEAAGFYRSLQQPRYLNGWLNRAYA
jgi:lysozyme family protein